MRTTITIDASLINELKEVSNANTKTQAVILAIQDFIRKRKVSKIKTLKGRISFDKTAEELRHYER